MDLSLSYQVHTFGCKVNSYDGGLLQKNLKNAGFQPHENSDPRIHVLNTCAVTAEATKEAVRMIRRLKVKDPFCTVVVTGCAAQVDTGAFSNLPGADLVIANSHKGQLPDLLKKHFQGALKEKVFKSNIFRKDDVEPGGGTEKSHTRAFLKIQDGCNSFCTYCVIPYARGKSRSLTVTELISRVWELEAQGTREVVLTGIHIGDYEDFPDLVLEDLLEKLLEKTRMPRFRVSSLEPVEVTDRLLQVYQNPRFCPHFHMSIQSANTDVLSKMKRKYTQEDVRKSLLNIQSRVPGAFVGMDVIAGFPTETDEQFEDTFECLRSLPWTRLHVFPYSERPGTRAATYENQVRPEIRAARAERLRDLSLKRYEEEARKQIGTTKQVLVLNQASKGAESLSRDYWPVKIMGADAFIESWRGQEVSVKITDYQASDRRAQEGCLLGEVVND